MQNLRHVQLEFAAHLKPRMNLQQLFASTMFVELYRFTYSARHAEPIARSLTVSRNVLCTDIPELPSKERFPTILHLLLLQKAASSPTSRFLRLRTWRIGSQATPTENTITIRIDWAQKWIKTFIPSQLSNSIAFFQLRTLELKEHFLLPLGVKCSKQRDFCASRNSRELLERRQSDSHAVWTLAPNWTCLQLRAANCCKQDLDRHNVQEAWNRKSRNDGHKLDQRKL